jgi:hypothetical protein
MSAFGGKADMTFCENPLSRSLLGVKRTWVDALQMSANDPKRTLSLHRHAGYRPDFRIEGSRSASRRTAGSKGRSTINFCNSMAARAASQSSMA